MATALEKANKEMGRITNKLSVVVKQLDRASSLVSKSATAYDQAAKSMEATAQKQHKAVNSMQQAAEAQLEASKKIEQASKAQQEASKEQTSEKSTNKFLTRFQKMLPAMRGVGAAVGAISGIASIASTFGLVGGAAAATAGGAAAAGTTAAVGGGAAAGTAAAGASVKGMAGIGRALGGAFGIAVAIGKRVVGLIQETKLLERTIGAAASSEYEQITLSAKFQGDQQKADQFYNYLENRAAESVFKKDQFVEISGTLASISTEMPALEQMTTLSERLGAANPAVGLSGAADALKQLAEGDASSLAQALQVPSDVLAPIMEAPLEEKLKAIEDIMGGKGWDNSFMERLEGSTTAQFNEVKERAALAFEDMGVQALEHLKPILNQLNAWMSGDAMKTVIDFGSKILGGLASGLSQAFSFLSQHSGTFMQAFRSILQLLQPVFQGLQSVIVSVMDAIRPKWDQIVTAFQTGINNLRPVYETLGNYIRMIGDVVATVLPVVMDIFSTVFPIITGIVGELSSAIGWLIENIVMPLIPVIGTVLEAVWGVVKPILEGLYNLFMWISEKIRDFADMIKKVKVPDWIKDVGDWIGIDGGKESSTVDGRHETGLSYVPYDGYVAELHKGERVMTASENRSYSHNQRALQLGKLADTIVVREEADIDRIADAIAGRVMEAGALV